MLPKKKPPIQDELEGTDPFYSCGAFDTTFKTVYCIFWLILLLTIIIVWQDFLKRVYGRETREKKPLNKIIKLLATCFLTLGIFPAFCEFTYFLLWCIRCLNIISQDDLSVTMTNKYAQPFHSTAAVFYTIEFLIILCTFLFRLKTTFFNTIFAYKESTYSLFLGIVFFDFIIGMNGIIFGLILSKSNINDIYSSTNNYGLIGFIFLSIHFVLYIIIAYFLLYLFVSSLFKLSSISMSKKKGNYNYSSMYSSKYNYSSDTTHHDHGDIESKENFEKAKRIHPIISRYFILASMAVLSTLLFATLYGMLVIVPENKTYIVLYFVLGYLPFEYIFNLSSFVLQFAFYKKYYVKLCSICDKWLKNKLVQKYQSENDKDKDKHKDKVKDKDTELATHVHKNGLNLVPEASPNVSAPGTPQG